MHHNGSRPGPHAPLRTAATAPSLLIDRRSEGLRGLGFDILRKRGDPLDVTAAGIHSPAPNAGARAHLRHIARKQPCDVDHRRFARAECRNRKGHDDGRIIGSLHGLRDWLGWIGRDVVSNLAQEYAVLAPFPAPHKLIHVLAAVTGADRVLRDLADEQEILAELGGRDLVVVRVRSAFANLVDLEDAFGGFGVFGDYAVIGTGLIWCCAPASSTGCRRRRRHRRYIRRRRRSGFVLRVQKRNCKTKAAKPKKREPAQALHGKPPPDRISGRPYSIKLLQ